MYVHANAFVQVWGAAVAEDQTEKMNTRKKLKEAVEKRLLTGVVEMTNMAVMTDKTEEAEEDSVIKVYIQEQQRMVCSVET